MISKPIENPIIAISVKVYQMLLVAYPTKFQKEYGPHMLQVFRDCCLRAFRKSGRYGMLKLWALTLFDLFRSLIEEHLQKETFMTRSKFIRLSGWSLILGAVALFLFIMGNSEPPFIVFSYLLGGFVAPILLGIGLLGLRTRYGDKVGGFWNNILLLGAIGGFLINIAGAVISLNSDWGWSWLLPLTGNAVLFACLSIFGIPVLSEKPLPRWNGLPLLAGIWYPVIIVLAYIFEALGLDQNSLGNLSNLIIPIQCVLLVVLGYMLQADVPDETALTA